ncbi:hypothetical protein I4U23_030914 [Adineta vaga]|nr:hypothetical protein I4U23_030914 [Adineta vaga]
MFNRGKRRPLFVLLLVLHLIVLSTYTILRYQTTTETETYPDRVLTEADPFAKPLPPGPLPADLIEKSERLLLHQNYKRFNKQQITKDENQKLTLAPCSLLPPNLVGRVTADLFSYEMKEVEEHLANSSIQLGGHWHPSHCTAHYRVAIIIPYRNRDMQLRIFLNFMHSFLQKQQIDYQIYLIEPIEGIKFNRALLFNIGFRETLKQYPWQCFIFHDVDLIPEDDRNIYSCPPEPRHMSVSVNTFNYELPYRGIFGGVSAMTVKQMETVNGFSNQFFGWGGEDDDMSGRIITKYRISRYPASIGRYRMLRHRPDTPNSNRFTFLHLGTNLMSHDGLSNLQYEIVDIEKKKLFTHIRVTYNETLIKSTVAHLVKKKKKSH